MGNPSSHFTDFQDAAQVNLWREVVRRVVGHYVQRYGIGMWECRGIALTKSFNN